MLYNPPPIIFGDNNFEVLCDSPRSPAEEESDLASLYRSSSQQSMSTIHVYDGQIEPWNILANLPIRYKQENSCTLEDCIQDYFKPISIPKESHYRCDHCHQIVDCDRFHVLYRPPLVLVFNIMRYGCTDRVQISTASFLPLSLSSKVSGIEKVCQKVDFPLYVCFSQMPTTVSRTWTCLRTLRSLQAQSSMAEYSLPLHP